MRRSELAACGVMEWIVHFSTTPAVRFFNVQAFEILGDGQWRRRYFVCSKGLGKGNFGYPNPYSLDRFEKNPRNSSK
ncbi:hypothetical protein AVEN_254008-1 [Araneus ventricosus]|uniref:Uncharacterized protein n=1 Tax=Araneus ventricosus TaxID=182803 RepID=A0A4Y2E6G1_ARAVE|nr:hypothetical protein AVEN_254008-1 [Araneus ventricosus]